MELAQISKVSTQTGRKPQITKALALLPVHHTAALLPVEPQEAPKRASTSVDLQATLKLCHLRSGPTDQSCANMYIEIVLLLC